MRRPTYPLIGGFIITFVVLCRFPDVRQDAILQYLDRCKAQHAGHQAVGHLLRPPDHDLRRYQPILQVGVGSLDGRTDLEVLLLGGRKNPLLLSALVRIYDGYPAVVGDESPDGFASCALSISEYRYLTRCSVIRSKGMAAWLSCTFAPVTMALTGMPLSVTSRCSL